MFGRIYDFLNSNREKARQRYKQAIQQFKLAPAKGFPYYVKFGLFGLFGYYNVKLFLYTVPGWEGWLTAVFALGLEIQALYCIRNYVRSAGQHKVALGVCGAALTLFSFAHATLSFFKVEQNRRWAETIEWYSRDVAFPLLFMLLFVSSLWIFLSHWKQKVAQEQAKAMADIERREARMLAEGHARLAEAELEQGKLDQLEDQIRIEGEYISKLNSYIKLKEREIDIVRGISDPALREKVARELGLDIDSTPPLLRDYGESGKGLRH
jgi:hypothetical protein